MIVSLRFPNDSRPIAEGPEAKQAWKHRENLPIVIRLLFQILTSRIFALLSYVTV